MKLNTIVIIFNLLIVVSFLFVFLLPVSFLGWEFATGFWADHWYLTLIFVAVLVLLDGYFARNAALFSALEKEHWPRVIDTLRHRIYTKGRASDQNVYLLVNAYLVSSKPEGIGELEAHLREHNRKALSRNALLLGIPRLLSSDGERIRSFYGEFRTDQGTRNDEGWVEWCYGYGSLLAGEYDDARASLVPIADRSGPGVLKALAVYLLRPFVDLDAAFETRIASYRDAITAHLSKRDWERRVDRARGKLHVLVLSTLVRDVGDWLYPPPSGVEDGT